MNGRFFYPQIMQITQIISREKSDREKERRASRRTRGIFFVSRADFKFFNLRNLRNLRIEKSGLALSTFASPLAAMLGFVSLTPAYLFFPKIICANL
jgi:hypothetical protein